MSKSQNPISVKSRKLIMQALLNLMQEKEYSSITITELVQNAKLVRKTFYRNFKNKDEVLDEFIEYLFQGYFKMLENLTEKNQLEIIKAYFIFWKAYASILKLLEKNNLLTVILTKYDELLPKINSYYDGSPADDSMQSCYEDAYTSGGYWRLLCKWIQRDFRETPEEMADLAFGFISSYH